MNYALRGLYPIETKEQVKTAEDYFTKYLTNFSPVDRVVAATNLEKRASLVGVALKEDWVTNYSRMTKEASPVSPTFEANLMMRKEACDNKELTPALDKIAQLKNEGASGKLLVAAIDEFDKTAGLYSNYDSSIMDSVFTVYGCLHNPEFDSVKLAEGITDYSAKRASNNEDTLVKIASQLGDGFSDSFKNAPMTTILSSEAPELSILSSIINQ